MHTDLACDAAAGSDERHASYEVVLQAVERARGLTCQLMSFTGGGVPRRAEVNIPPLVDEALDGLRVYAGIAVERRLAAELPPVWADADQLSRVLHNLVRNAIQAMEYEGTLSIDVDVVDGAGDRMVSLSVSDSGPGVPVHLRKRIFDPYFTSRQDGTGLGLATSYWILRRHGGNLLVAETDTGGACFRMVLPAFHARAVRSLSEPTVDLPVVRVLVLEDEPGIAAGILQVLQRRGHDCVVVSMGQQVTPSWKQARDDGYPFDVALIDLIQPTGVGGRAALERLRAVTPHAPVVLMSGHAQDEAMTGFRAHGAQVTLHKPFRPAALLTALAAALRQSAGSASSQSTRTVGR